MTRSFVADAWARLAIQAEDFARTLERAPGHPDDTKLAAAMRFVARECEMNAADKRKRGRQ